MSQLSVYSRICKGEDTAEKHKKKAEILGSRRGQRPRFIGDEKAMRRDGYSGRRCEKKRKKSARNSWFCCDFLSGIKEKALVFQWLFRWLLYRVLIGKEAITGLPIAGG